MPKSDFFDKRHDKVQDRYYEIACDKLELINTKSDARKIVKELEDLIKVDPGFLDSYNLAAEILRDDLGEDEKANQLEKQAYDVAIKTIADKHGGWPKNLIWGYLENRHIIRAIDRWAYNLWWKRETDQALEIFHKLLSSNLGDNIGARFSILAIRMGLRPDYDKKWAGEYGIDVLKLHKWWNRNYKKYIDDFKDWDKEWGSE